MRWKYPWYIVFSDHKPELRPFQRRLLLPEVPLSLQEQDPDPGRSQGGAVHHQEQAKHAQPAAQSDNTGEIENQRKHHQFLMCSDY